MSDYKGKKVYLKFWASWCSICLASLPDTDEIAKDAGDDYVVLTVVSPGHKGEQAEADFKNWYKGLDYKNFPVLIDPSGETFGKLWCPFLPNSSLYRQGRKAGQNATRFYG